MQVLDFLSKHPNSTRQEIGVDYADLRKLVDSGQVVASGVRPTSKRGRNPVVYALAGSNVAVPIPPPPDPRDRPAGSWWAEFLAGRDPCGCGFTADNPPSLNDLMKMGSGCTAGRWVCGTLDAARRRMGH